MDTYYLKSYIKTMISMCAQKDDLINELVVKFDMEQQDATKLYLTCLEEMGQ